MRWWCTLLSRLGRFVQAAVIELHSWLCTQESATTDMQRLAICIAAFSEYQRVLLISIRIAEALFTEGEKPTFAKAH